MTNKKRCAAIRSRDELNYFMAPLEQENARLRRENARLRRQNAELTREKATLKEKPRLLLCKELDEAGVWQWRIARRSDRDAAGRS
jgi:hypothetical protein